MGTMIFRRAGLLAVWFSLSTGAVAGELPVSWQRFFPVTATNGTPAARTLTVAAVSFDTNEPVGGKALSSLDRAHTNMLRMAEIVRQVRRACREKARAGGACEVYGASPILVCFPEEAVTGEAEIDENGVRDAASYSREVLGVGTGDYTKTADWRAYLGEVPFPGDFVTRGLRDIATNENVYLVCSYCARNPDGERQRNVCTLFGPEASRFSPKPELYGVIGYNYKVHPIGGENETIQRGDRFSVWQTKVGRIGMMVCYDMFFPESARTLAVEGADLIVAVSAWLRYYPQIGPEGIAFPCRQEPGSGIEPDGLDECPLSTVSLMLRAAACQSGVFLAGSHMANPGGIGHSSVINLNGRVFCVAKGRRLPHEKTDDEAFFRPGIAIANVGSVSLERETAALRRGVGFLEDRHPEAYAPLTRGR